MLEVTTVFSTTGQVVEELKTLLCSIRVHVYYGQVHVCSVAVCIAVQIFDEELKNLNEEVNVTFLRTLPCSLSSRTIRY